MRMRCSSQRSRPRRWPAAAPRPPFALGSQAWQQRIGGWQGCDGAWAEVPLLRILIDLNSVPVLQDAQDVGAGGAHRIGGVEALGLQQNLSGCCTSPTRRSARQFGFCGSSCCSSCHPVLVTGSGATRTFIDRYHHTNRANRDSCVQSLASSCYAAIFLSVSRA